jgi:uracil-DNA glycosylase
LKFDVSAQVDASWVSSLRGLWESSQLQQLADFISQERAHHTVYPPRGQVFTALKETPFDEVRVVIVGQDPYHGPGQAHGLSFSVPPGIGLPPSLRNIYRELESDLGQRPPPDGSLLGWARQGVLLLNAVLTVREGEPASHQGKGWESVTDAIMESLWTGTRPVAFVLWGRFAATTFDRIRRRPAGADHLVLKSAHPSPLSAHQGFLGSRPFSKINDWLAQRGELPIQWGAPSSR